MSSEDGKDLHETFNEIVSGIVVDEQLREQVIDWELKRTILAMNEAAMFLGKFNIELTGEDVDEVDGELIQLLLHAQQLCANISEAFMNCDCPDCCDCDPDDICESCEMFLMDEDDYDD